MTFPVGSTVAEALAASALDTLASTVSTERIKAWQQVQQLVPALKGDISDLVRAIARTHRRRKPWKVQTPRDPRVCTVCHRDLPHNTPPALSRHGYYLNLRKTRRNRWAKYPLETDRQAQTTSARLAVLRETHDRWLRALRLHNPLAFDHLMATQGREAAITLWRSLPPGRRRRLLRAVPRPPKRRFKGELLVRHGIRTERPPSPNRKEYP